MTQPTTTLSTGIDVLDRKLDGGIPAGRVTALMATPASQAELLLYEMAGVRETVYLTTERRPAEIEASLERAGVPLDDVAIHCVTAEGSLGDARMLIDDLSPESTVIVDTVDPLESAPDADYRAFMNHLKSRTVETGSLALLHCLDGRQVPPQRDRTEYFSDVVFDLVTTFRGGSVKNRLAVPKFRGGSSLSDAIELDLRTDVTIDVSRKIA